jgi:hypothetical protein
MIQVSLFVFYICVCAFFLFPSFSHAYFTTDLWPVK